MWYFPCKIRFVGSIGLEDFRYTRHCHVVNLVNRETSCVVISAPAASLEKLRRLSELAALETLSRYFDATRDSDMASAPVQVGQIF